MSPKTYTITLSNLLQLAHIASELDSLKGAQPDGWQTQCLQLISEQHHIIGAVLGNDEHLAYAPEISETAHIDFKANYYGMLLSMHNALPEQCETTKV